jgi:sialidase-1
MLSAFPQDELPNLSANGLKFTSLFNTSQRDSVSCYRIPALATAPNGDLLAAIDERIPSCGDLRSNPNINIVLRRSMDNGISWTEQVTIVDYPYGQSASDPSFIVDNLSGEIFLFFNYMDVNKEKDVYYLKLIRSRDGGKKWSTPEDITAQITKPEWNHYFKFITSGNGTQTRSGKLLHTLVSLEEGVFVFGSDNHGESWYLIDKPLFPADESRIIELADGSWMVNSRVNGKGYRLIHTSPDEGKTWNAIVDTTLADPGCNAGLIRYSSIADGDDRNRLIFSNLNSGNQRRNLTVKISYDEGKSWSEGKTIYSGSSAYSAICVLPGGEIGLFFEKDEYTDNVFLNFTISWLTEGKDKGIKKM